MKTVRHWKRSYKCDHRAEDIKGALTLALNCQGLSLKGVSLMTVLLEDRGYAEFIVPGVDSYMFRVMGRRH